MRNETGNWRMGYSWSQCPDAGTIGGADSHIFLWCHGTSIQRSKAGVAFWRVPLIDDGSGGEAGRVIARATRCRNEEMCMAK